MRMMDVRVDGRPVALARMLLAFALVLFVLECSAVLSGIAEGKLRFPVWELLPGPTPGSVRVYLAVGLLAAICLFLGLFANAAAAAGAAVLAWAMLWDQQTYSNHLVLGTLLLGYLAFADADRRWGLASRRFPERSVPWWPQLLLMMQVAVCYLFSGLSKINPRFLSGEPLQGWMWLDAPLWLFQTMSVATVVVEISLAACLWIPRLRVPAVVAGLALHVSIVVGLSGQNVILFVFAACCGATYWLFLSRPRASTAARSITSPAL
jgi:hypothetical protein